MEIPKILLNKANEIEAKQWVKAKKKEDNPNNFVALE